MKQHISAEKLLLYLPVEECKTQENRQRKLDQQKLTKMKDLQMVRDVIPDDVILQLYFSEHALAGPGRCLERKSLHNRKK